MEELNKIASEGGYDFSKKLEYGESRLLDPLFWQALGKACGWKKDEEAIKRLEKDIEYENASYESCLAHPTETEQFYQALERQRAKIQQMYSRLEAYKSNFDWKGNALRFHEIILNEGMDKGIEYLKSIVVK